MKVAMMLKFIRKQLTRFWKNQPKPDAEEERHYDPEDTNAQQAVREHQQLSEPHLMPPPVKPEHSIKHECRVEDSLGQNAQSQEPAAEAVQDLRQQLSKMAARAAEVLCRLRDAEEALGRRLQKHSLDQMHLISLQEENARLVARVNRQERVWLEKFHHLVSLNNVLAREKEQEELELERQALKTMITNLEKHHKTQKCFQKRTLLMKKISRRYTNHH